MADGQLALRSRANQGLLVVPRTGTTVGKQDQANCRAAAGAEVMRLEPDMAIAPVPSGCPQPSCAGSVDSPTAGCACCC